MEFKKITTRENVYKGIDLWNRINSSFFIISCLVEQNIFTPFAGVNVRAWGAFEEDNLLAFALIKYLTIPIIENGQVDEGWISLIVIDKKNIRINSIGNNFFKIIERDLKEKGIHKVYFGRDPQNFLPGLPANLDEDYLLLLEKMGYKKEGVVYDLYQDISKFTISPKIAVLQKELELNLQAKMVTKETEKSCLEFLKTFFPGRWHYEAKNIRRIPGGIEDYWLLWCNNVPVGFARTNTSESLYMGSNVNWGSQKGQKYCGLGPIGIANNCRGRGYGIYLMINIIQYFQQKGYRHMIIDWTDLLDYYAKVEFKPWIKYFLLYKNL